MRKLLQLKSFIFILAIIFSFTLISCNNTPIENPVNNPTEENSQVSNFKLEFSELENKINKERAMGVIQHLVDVSPRLAGTDGEKAAAQYIQEEFTKLGFTSTLEEFPMISFKANQWNLTIHNGDDTLQLESNCLNLSSSTPDEGLENIPLVFGGMGLIADVAYIDMNGKIAVVNRGRISFKEKVINCANRGAMAVIIINSEDAPLNATLLEKSPIPAVSLSLSEGTQIMNVIDSESLRADLIVDTTFKDSISQNVIGIKESNKKDAKTLIIGAHYDSVDCPGANDNGSGVAGLMELAYILSDYDLPFNIHFIAFGSEEIGLVGSKYNVDNNNYNSKNIIGMINMDMIGMGEHLAIFKKYSFSDNTFYNLATSAAQDLNLKAVNDYSERSDHASFESAKIPVVFLAYHPWDPLCYHTEKDTIDTIDPSLVENTIKVIFKMITSLINE